MLPTKEDSVQSGDLGGEVIDMQLDANALAHIRSILTDLYSDKEAAVIREYITNARDAQIANGVTKPIEVSSPTALSPKFVVKDHGVGMSAEDIKNIYSKYGASTKRGTNSQTGMLGLGAKSALTYTHQFNIKSVKDGKKILVAVSRDAAGDGKMSILSESPTDEPSGTEITIPAKPSWSFNSKLKNFVRFWEPGSVLVDGVPNETFEHIKITEKVWLATGLHGTFIVQGGVTYEDTRFLRPYGLVIFVDMGEINFTPSRESLHYTNLTVNTIEKYVKEFEDNIVSAISKTLEDCKSKDEAVKRAYTWRRSSLPSHYTSALKYRGEVIPSYVSTRWRANYMYGDIHLGHEDYEANINDVQRSVAFIGVEGKTINSWSRSKLKMFLDEKGHQGIVLLLKDFPERDWFDIDVYDWADVKKLKLNAKEREKTKFKLAAPYGRSTLEKDELDPKKEIAYMALSEYDKLNFNVFSVLDKDKVQVVMVPPSKQEAFVKKHPKAKTVRSMIKEHVQNYFDNLDEQEHLYYILGYNEKTMLRGLKAENIDDPRLKRVIEAIETQGKKYSSSSESVFSLMKSLASMYNVKYSVPQRETLGGYHLIEPGAPRNAQHIEIYINAVYNTLYKERNEI